ncbi:iron-containing alcohol dehydrogenase [Marivita sp. XM-24bin2]|uniref:iron-containing alcohol dehydrogenase n=1 Tax=Marivita sp. XM-24bin2 TaxID=2133951 RepID=UPI000D79E335|nr:iron-containing alcohol dehydrogenase [Marivita sp. XM-24bin2]PWL33421.1 MAG: alcohol dehydrogenase [Marivita sp. XM-24bin2]
MLPAFSFVTATEIRFGRGEARHAVPEMAGLGRRFLLVHGRDAARSAWIVDALTAEGYHVTGFAIPGEPDVAMIESGVDAARAVGAQSVSAIGGGAVIDVAKAIAALVPPKHPILDHLEVVGQGLQLEADPLPFVALPTTGGTGVEATRNAVIAMPEARRKDSLLDRRILPHLAIVDPSLTDDCPAAVPLASGLDAVTQVIEPFICNRTNPMTDALSRPAIATGLNALVSLMDDQMPEARDRMAWTSLCGGLALANAGLGAVYGLAGPLGGLSGAAHGAICGALLPHGLEVNAAVATGETARRLDMVRKDLAEALSCAHGAASVALDTLARQARLPGLDAQRVTGDHWSQAADMTAESSSMKANPVQLSADDLSKIMENAR